MSETPFRYLSWALRGLLSALLPSPERERVATGYGIFPARWSFALGVIGGTAGLLLYIDGALAFIVPLSGDQAEALLEKTPRPGLNRLAGSIAWIAWHLQPQAWLYMYMAFVGLARVLAFAITRQPVGEPAIILPLRTFQWLAGGARHGGRLARLGPLRPDRVVEQANGDLLVMTCRGKDDWDELATIEIGERFYRVIDVADRKDGKWTAIGYRLRELGPTEPIRSLVKYQ